MVVVVVVVMVMVSLGLRCGGEWWRLLMLLLCIGEIEKGVLT